ncbi:MAG: NAD(P)H-dependent amine dehydrogenase family protein [Solirubrobacterales bacterium]
MTYRVIQWATGNVGSHSLRNIAARPRLELTGLYVYSAEKAGRDAGQICGIEPLGVTATSDLDEILALDADCVAYNALGETRDPEQSLADICQVLGSGKNVVSTAVSTHIYPIVLTDDTRDRLEAACREGDVSFHSTGINPGFGFDVLPITLSSIAGRIDRIHVTELVNMSGYTSEAIVHGFIGMGLPPDIDAPLDLQREVFGTSYHASMQLIADAMRVELEDIRLERLKVPTGRDLELPWGRVTAGTTAARRIRHEGVVGGAVRIVFDVVWRVSNEVAPEWPVGDARYELDIEGNPSLRCRFDIGVESGRHISMVTALHAVNAIPYVCEGEPGVQTFLELPLMGGGYFSPSE